MNDGSTTTSAIATAQPRTSNTPMLRSASAVLSTSFGQMLEALTRPSPRPEPTTIDETSGKAAADASDQADSAESNEDTADSAEAEDGSGEQAPNEGEARASNTGSPSGIVPIGTVASEYTTGEIARELTHAATVDLSQVASEELQNPKHSEKHKDLYSPGQALRPGNPGPIHASGQGQGKEQRNGITPHFNPAPRAVEARANEVPIVRVEPAPARNEAAMAAGPNPVGANTADAARASSAVAQTPVARSEPAQPVSLAGAVGRAGMLERLTGSVEAARGAVTGAERVGLQSSTLRDTSAGRPIALTPAAPLKATREAVLNTVQRGLASVLTQGGGRMTVVLRPEALGEVRVRLEAKDGVVNARLSATTDAARRTLESGLDSLRTALEARGVRVESLRIDPPDQNQSANTSADGGRTDADARGGQGGHPREHRANQHAANGAGHPRTEPALDSELYFDGQSRSIWTELGIDAVA